MPSQYTHQLIAEAVFGRLPSEIRARLTSPAAFALGAQGGDAYFFCWLNDGRRCNLGRRMHCRGIYRDFCMLARARNGWQYSYAAGYICHYAADTVFHPFVYALCARLAGEERRRAKWHAYIESDLDTYFVQSRAGIPVAAYELPLSFADVDVSALLPLVRAVSGAAVSERALRAALRRFFWYVRWFRDKHGRRRRFFAGAERTLCAPRLLSCLYRRAECDPRVRNAAGEEWHNPADPSFSSCEDADALFDRAVREGVRLVSLFFRCVRDGEPLPAADFCLHFLKGTPVPPAKKMAGTLASPVCPPYTEGGGEVMQKFYDSDRKLVGYLRSAASGKILAYDSDRMLVGYYNPASDKTYDANRVLVGRGNLLAAFFKDAVN